MEPTQYIKIGNACIKLWSQSIRIGNARTKIWNRVFSALCDIFRHCELLRKSFQKFLTAPPVRLRLPSARIIITPADNLFRLRINYYACG